VVSCRGIYSTRRLTASGAAALAPTRERADVSDSERGERGLRRSACFARNPIEDCHEKAQNAQKGFLLCLFVAI
jgi:hypothetical protein